MEQDSYLGLVRDRTGLSYDMLKRELVEGAQPAHTDGQSGLDSSFGKSTDLLDFLSAEDRAAYFVLASRLFRKDYAEGVSLPATDNPFFRLVSDYLEACRQEGKAPVFGELYAVEGIDNFSRELQKLHSVQFTDTDADAKYFADCLTELNKTRLKTQIKALNDAYETETDAQKKLAIAVELSALTRKNSDKN